MQVSYWAVPEAAESRQIDKLSLWVTSCRVGFSPGRLGRGRSTPHSHATQCTGMLYCVSVTKNGSLIDVMQRIDVGGAVVRHHYTVYLDCR